MNGGAALLRWITTDRARPWVGLACVAFISWMGLRHVELVRDRADWIEGCLSAPVDCDGRRVFLSLVRVTQLHSDGYTVQKALTPIRIQGDPRRRTVGQTVSVVATFEGASGALVEQTPTPHPWRKTKRRLGLLGVAVAFMFAVVSWRPSRRGMVARG